MADTGADGQDALRLIARARRALVEEGRISVDALLGAYRALAKSSPAFPFHPGAALDAVDVASLKRWRALGGDPLLRAKTIVVHAASPRSAPKIVASSKEPLVELHAPHTEEAAGDALLLALALSLESAKLAHGLSAPADTLRAAFATPNDAKAALDALARGGTDRDVVLASLPSSSPRVDARALSLHANAQADRNAYVIVGAGAWRVHDMLSPFARRLRTELVALADRIADRIGAKHGRDDDVYAAVDALLADAASIGVHEERVNVERADAFFACGAGCIAVKCEQMSDDVDRRAKESASNLKRARALLVFVEPHASSLHDVLAALSTSVRAIAIVGEASSASTPRWCADLASGHVTAVDNAFENAQGVLVTTPSLAVDAAGAFASSPFANAAIDAGAFALVQCALSAQAAGAIAPSTKIALRSVARDDHTALSRACLDVLARLGPRKAR